MEYYKISEFARAIGVSATTLREYERKGLLIPHHKGFSGYRYYSQQQVDEYLSGVHTRKKGEYNEKERI